MFVASCPVTLSGPLVSNFQIMTFIPQQWFCTERIQIKENISIFQMSKALFVKKGLLCLYLWSSIFKRPVKLYMQFKIFERLSLNVDFLDVRRALEVIKPLFFCDLWYSNSLKKNAEVETHYIFATSFYFEFEFVNDCI